MLNGYAFAYHASDRSTRVSGNTSLKSDDCTLSRATRLALRRSGIPTRVWIQEAAKEPLGAMRHDSRFPSKPKARTAQMLSNVRRHRSLVPHVVLIVALIGASSLFNLGGTESQASSHREAPVISQDPAADNTDVYAFVSPDRPDTVTLIANYYPFQDPAGFPNFYRFGDDVAYDIHVDSTGGGFEDIIYRFEFTTETLDPSTFLYATGPVESLDDPNLNVRQFYTVTEIRAGESTVIAEGLQTPPSHIGPTSTPDYPSLAAAAVYDVGNGVQVFAGQRDDSFFVDLGGIGDLLTIRQPPGNAGGGIDELMGLNVQTIALQVPISQVTSDGSVPTDPADPAAVIGVWATSSRFSTTIIGDDGTRNGEGDLVQVSRLANPLVNELVVPLQFKDMFNASIPSNDAQFLPAVLNPELPGLLTALYGVDVPEGDRDDLVAVFLTGVAGLNQPSGVTPSEQMRLNVAIPPATDPSRLGVLGGDLAGFPNGRRPADDVVDIELRVVAGVLVEGFDVAPNNQLGDGVDANDREFLGEFPYLATPSQGFSHDHHEPGGITVMPETGTGP